MNVLVTRPRSQIPLGVHSSKTQTTSFTSNLASGFNHFFLVFRVWMYSFRSLFQIASSRCRTWVHVFVWIVGVSLKPHARTLGKALPIIKWLGVNGSSSSMSLLTCVKGLASTRLFFDNNGWKDVPCQLRRSQIQEKSSFYNLYEPLRHDDGHLVPVGGVAIVVFLLHFLGFCCFKNRILVSISLFNHFFCFATCTFV